MWLERGSSLDLPFVRFGRISEPNKLPTRVKCWRVYSRAASAREHGLSCYGILFVGRSAVGQWAGGAVAADSGHLRGRSVHRSARLHCRGDRARPQERVSDQKTALPGFASGAVSRVGGVALGPAERREGG